MCGGGDDSSDTQTSTQTNTIPAWAQNEAQGQIGLANAYQAQGYQPYTGPRVADWTPQMNSAGNMLDSSVGSWKPGLDWTTGAAQQDANFQAPTVGANGWQDFYNPNMQSIYDQIGRAGEAQRNTIDRQALKYGTPMGAGRQLAIGRQMEGQNRAIGQTSADAFNSAMGQNLQTQSTNASNALQSQAARLGVNKQLAALLGQGQQMSNTDINSLFSMGQQRRNDAQTILDNNYQQFQEARDFPLRALQARESALRGTPMPQTSTTTSPGPNSTAQNVGLGISAAGIAPSLVKMLSGLFSS